MSVYGVTGAGLVAKPATQSKADLDGAFKSIYGESIGSEPDGSIPAASSIGQEVGLIVDSESSGWEVLQALFAAFDPNQAGSPYLQILCQLTGTLQKLATWSVATETCFGVVGTQLPPGRIVKVIGTNVPFASQDNAADPNAPNSTLSAVSTPWATSTAYALNSFVNANGKIWQCSVPGTSSNMGSGPTGAQYSTQTDGTVSWIAVCATGLGVALVPFTAQSTGPLAATSLQLSQIATPVGGWQGAFNALDAVLGRDAETDPALRTRRVLELQAQGGGPANSIRAALLALADVQDCKVFVNSTNVVNGDGVPAHGVEVLLLAPALSDQELADAVWLAVGAGTAMGGSISKTVIDSSGNPQTVKFSRPTEVPIYIVVTTYYDPAKWPGSNPGAAVEAATVSALLNFTSRTYGIGVSVRMIPLASAVEDGPQAVAVVSGVPQPLYPGSPYGDAPAGSTAMPGVVDVLLYLGTAPAPATQTTIAIGGREIAAFTAARIDTTATPQSP